MKKGRRHREETEEKKIMSVAVEQYRPINRCVGNMVEIKEYPTHVRPGEVPNAYEIKTKQDAGDLCEVYENDWYGNIFMNVATDDEEKYEWGSRPNCGKWCKKYGDWHRVTEENGMYHHDYDLSKWLKLAHEMGKTVGVQRLILYMYELHKQEKALYNLEIKEGGCSFSVMEDGKYDFGCRGKHWGSPEHLTILMNRETIWRDMMEDAWIWGGGVDDACLQFKPGELGSERWYSVFDGVIETLHKYNEIEGW